MSDVAGLRMLDHGMALADGKRTEADPLNLYRCTPPRVSRSKAFCLAHLGRASDAIVAGERTLETIPPALARTRGELMLEMTPALIQRREIPAACQKINTAAHVAAGNSSTRVSEMIRRSRIRLEPWAKTRHVRELDQDLKTLGIAS